MGIRETQFIGLNQHAHALLHDPMKIIGRDYIRRVLFGSDGESIIEDVNLEKDITEPTIKKEEYDLVQGMFEEKIPLYRWTFSDGRIYEEREQAHFWSSGPVIFTALFDVLENKWVKGTRWSRADMNSY